MSRMVRCGLIQASCEWSPEKYSLDEIKKRMIAKHETLIAQAGILAYIDVFLYCAIVAFAFVPLTFFFSPVKASGGPGAG